MNLTKYFWTLLYAASTSPRGIWIKKSLQRHGFPCNPTCSKSFPNTYTVTLFLLTFPIPFRSFSKLVPSRGKRKYQTSGKVLNRGVMRESMESSYKALPVHPHWRNSHKDVPSILFSSRNPVGASSIASLIPPNQLHRDPFKIFHPTWPGFRWKPFGIPEG